MMTAYGTIETAVKAVKEGAYDFLTKPFDPDHLLILIAKALEKQRLVTENIVLKDELAKQQQKFPRVIGKSPKILEVIEKTRKVATGNTTVLLSGESGTGKELFARAIHELSPRKDGPFVGSIVRQSREIYWRASSSGMNGVPYRCSGQLGKFELADRDNLSGRDRDMDLALQAKILRILEGEEVMRGRDE
jgi:DNA-binding NtrC family response regulator